MGTFRVEVTVSNPDDRSRTRTLLLLVDTGSTYTTLPRDVIESLGVTPLGTRRVRLASGRVERWPVGAVSLRLEGEEAPTVCLIGPPGGPALLGAVTLESFALGVDPVGLRLVPIESYGLATALVQLGARGARQNLGRGRRAPFRSHAFRCFPNQPTQRFQPSAAASAR